MKVRNLKINFKIFYFIKNINFLILFIRVNARIYIYIYIYCEITLNFIMNKYFLIFFISILHKLKYILSKIWYNNVLEI